MAVVTALLILSPLSRLLLYIYPLMAVLASIYLYRRNLPAYVSLVCWLWFLSPAVRPLSGLPRLLDPGDGGAALLRLWLSGRRRFGFLPTGVSYSAARSLRCSACWPHAFMRLSWG